MGSIIEIGRSFRAEVRKKKGGRTLTLYQTFERRKAAEAWVKSTTEDMNKPGAFEAALAAKSAGRRGPARPTLGDAIDRSIAEAAREIKKTKAQVLRALRDHNISSMECESIESHHLVALAKELLDGGRDPSTVGNYMSHLSSVFSIARPAWNYPLAYLAMEDAQVVCKKLGYISKSNARDRRPTLKELDNLMTYFVERSQRRPSSAPMHRIIAFAIFSTRRLSEITGVLWGDVDQATAEQAAGVMVRKMKNPGDNVGIDTWCEFMPEALAIAEAMPRTGARIFPYAAGTIGTAFTRACEKLGIEDLHFHDLRHEGVSWLIECGRTEKQAMLVSGHKSPSSLHRYSNTRKIGNKYKDWKWLAIVTDPLIREVAASPSKRPRGAHLSTRPSPRRGRRGRLSGSSLPS